MAYDERSKKSIDAYRSKFVFIQIRVSQDTRERISKHANNNGESVNAFINRAINETIKNDIQKEQISLYNNRKESKEEYSALWILSHYLLFLISFFS